MTAIRGIVYNHGGVTAHSTSLRNRERTLSTVWRLRDVDDVEALVLGVVAWVANTIVGHTKFPDADRDELISALFEQVVVLDSRYDSTRAGIEFRPWAFSLLKLRAIDHLRRTYGRNGEKRVTAGSDGDGGRDGDGAGDDRLDEASLEDPADGVDARAWLYPGGDRDGFGDVDRHRRSPSSGVAASDDLAGALAAGSTASGASSDRGAVPWVDCACGWRHFPAAPNGVAAWHYPESCASCGEPLAMTGGADTLDESSSVRAVSNAAKVPASRRAPARLERVSSDCAGNLTSCV